MAGKGYCPPGSKRGKGDKPMPPKSSKGGKGKGK
jgi:hypothetical protein